MTLRQAAEVLGVRYEHAWRLKQRGRLPAERSPWGDLWLIHVKDVHAYADQRATRNKRAR